MAPQVGLVAAHCSFLLFLMANTIQILSCNVRGLGTSVKRLAVFRNVKSLRVDIICLQETHLSPATPHNLSPQMFAYQYHATYSTYSRGVSIFVQQGTQFACKQVLTDPNGRYLIILCTLFGVYCIIAGVYIPPPFSADVLKILASFMAHYPDTPFTAVGDYNNLLDLLWDKISSNPHNLFSPGKSTPFSRLMRELGIIGMWRLRHPTTKMFSCHLAAYDGLSRID